MPLIGLGFCFCKRLQPGILYDLGFHFVHIFQVGFLFSCCQKHISAKRKIVLRSKRWKPLFQPRNLGKADSSLSADPAVILVFPKDGFLAPIIGTGREPKAGVPPWILGPELQFLIFFTSHKSSFCSDQLQIICQRAKLTGKLEKGRERALGSQNLTLTEAAPSEKKNLWCWERPWKEKSFYQGRKPRELLQLCISHPEWFGAVSLPEHSCSAVPGVQMWE